MIRYPIDEADLIERINRQDSKWMKRARTRTQHYIDAGEYTAGDSDFWGLIKQVYIDLQYEKCAYCETRLQGATLVSKVHEVEHYRPKSSIRAWPNRAVDHWKDFPGAWEAGQASDTGYYRLAYHPLNYAIACTRCNSTLKSNYFPIRGVRDLQSETPTAMHAESALLLYPVSSVDPDDPQDIITFDGVLAEPVHSQGPAHERAVTNIEFFQLNHQDLTSRRADHLRMLCIALAPGGSAKQRRYKAKEVKRLCSEQSAFSACAQAYKKLYEEDPERAAQIADLLFDDLYD